jgi:transposase
VTLLLRKQRTPDRIEGREPLDWCDENHALLDGNQVSPIYTRRIHGEIKWACARLKPVPGIRPITSSVRVAAIGTGDVFCKGRDFATWLGQVPSRYGQETAQTSTRGNRYLLVLFVQAAWVVVIRPQSWERQGLKS